MKAAVLYFSQTGKTKAMAECIVSGMQQEMVDAKAFSIDEIDAEWLEESKCIVIGTPTYYADLSAKMKVFLETLAQYKPFGKLGGAFATAQYVHGGGDIAVQTILRHMLTYGMLAYSAGGSKGKPVIHLGPVGGCNSKEEDEKLFNIYGQRMAAKTKELFA